MATSEHSSSRSKIWLVVGGIVVLAGVAYVATIYPPDNESLAGSVTPANRYRAESATKGSGSVLGDQSIAQFMQTDMYQMIVSDRVLATTFASEGFRQALASDNFKQALASDNFKQALASDQFRQALASDQFRQALASDQFRQALASDQFRQALASDNFKQAMASDQFRQALASDSFRAALGQDAMRAVAQTQ
jgi:hypothetical protein